MCRTGDIALCEPASTSVTPLSGMRPLLQEVEYARLLLHLPEDEALSICVARGADRVKRGDTVAHVCRTVPDRSFRRVSAGVYVASPELCLLQLMKDSELVSSVRLGFEFCGTYSFKVGGTVEYGLAPLCNMQKVEKLSREVGRKRGLAGNRDAVHYIMDNSGSPYETDIAIAMSFSTVRGGYGMKGFSLNGEIEIPERLRARLGKDSYRCDFLWEEKRVILEYDSDSYHGSNRRSYDAIRVNALTELGYTVCTLTTNQLRYSMSFDTAMRSVRCCLGLRNRSEVRDLPARRMRLHKQLFDGLRR